MTSCRSFWTLTERLPHEARQTQVSQGTKKREADLRDHRSNLGQSVKLLTSILPHMNKFTTIQAARYRVVREALDVLAGELASKG